MSETTLYQTMKKKYRDKFSHNTKTSDLFSPLDLGMEISDETFLRYENILKVNNYWDMISNKVVPWIPSDSREHWDLNYKNRKEDLLKSGWMDTSTLEPKEIKYSLNQYGLRVRDLSDPIEPNGILWLGDSNIFGMGNHYTTNYSLKAHYNSQFKRRPYYNFGMPGAGIETYYRRLKHLIGIYKPHGIILEWHWSTTRREEFNQTAEFKFRLIKDEIDENNENDFKKYYKLYSAEASAIRYFTTYDAIKCLCYENDVHIFNMNDSTHLNESMRKIKRRIWAEPWTRYRFARDLIHTNEEWHNKRAENMIGIINQIWR